MAHYFQSRGPRQEAALKIHVRATPSPYPLCTPIFPSNHGAPDPVHLSTAPRTP